MKLISCIMEKLKKSSFWGSVVSLTSGQIIGQVITLFTTPIISRLYTSEEYGEFGIITSTATIIVSIVSLGLASAVMVVHTEQDAKRIFRVAYLIQVLMSTILCAGVMIISPYKQLYETTIPYDLSVLIMYVYIISSALMTMLNIYINRLKLNKVLFLNPVIAAVCTLIITLPFGFFKFGFIGLILASIVAFILSSIHMLRYGNPGMYIQANPERSCR
jgi:O-antigen/teichoic acid export membrane protein